MKLGLALGYWEPDRHPARRELVATAEDLGFDSMWSAEAYGSDALTPLAWLGARTSTIKLGTSVLQMSARTPTATAMAAMTLDHLSGGRMMVGVGASGPQVVEGWYGQPYPKPLARTREYVKIMRETIARERVTSEGPHYPIPYPGGTGLGKPLRSTIHPLRTDIPILLAAEGPKNVALAAEIADGWLPLFYAPAHDAQYRACLEEGFAARGGRPDNFEVPCTMHLVVDDDIEAAADKLRPTLALYIGGMGARGANFHYEVFARMGYEDACERIQDLYLGGRKAEAIAAVPLSLVEEVALIGPPAKITEDAAPWRDSLVTTMVIGGTPDTLKLAADLLR